MRPLIAVTCSTEEGATNYPRGRDFANRAYSEAVRRAGGAPVLLPLGGTAEDVRAGLAAAHGLLLTGGVDIDPGAYGEARRPECGQVDRLRDEVDRWALETAIERTLPVLGICRGIQALAAFLGGSLHQDIPGHQRTAARNVTTHEVVVEEGTLLSRIVGGGRLAVNSFHHQALRVVPPGYRISARATDGTVEGLEAADGAFRLGVQWHPEDLAAESALHQGLFDALVEAARYSSVTPDCRDLSP